jgi:hypothetical protein
MDVICKGCHDLNDSRRFEMETNKDPEDFFHPHVRISDRIVFYRGDEARPPPRGHESIHIVSFDSERYYLKYTIFEGEFSGMRVNYEKIDTDIARALIDRGFRIAEKIQKIEMTDSKGYEIRYGTLRANQLMKRLFKTYKRLYDILHRDKVD